jgi:hypothetical protein
LSRVLRLGIVSLGGESASVSSGDDSCSAGPRCDAAAWAAVLAFTHLRSGGDIFSPGIKISKSGKYHLAFDFLGKPHEGGGILGISLGTPSYHRWLVGTQKKGVGETNPLVDDGKWHHYTITVVPDGNKWFTADGARAVALQRITRIHIMIEQNWGTPGTAYFDNITLSTVHG